MDIELEEQLLDKVGQEFLTFFEAIQVYFDLVSFLGDHFTIKKAFSSIN